MREGGRRAMSAPAALVVAYSSRARVPSARVPSARMPECPNDPGPECPGASDQFGALVPQTSSGWGRG
jgi:hypothetical protein